MFFKSMFYAFFVLKNKSVYENGCPSPDGRENPCLQGSGKQDWNPNSYRGQEIAPSASLRIKSEMFSLLFIAIIFFSEPKGNIDQGD